MVAAFSQVSCKKPATGVTGTEEHGEHAHEEHHEGEHTEEQRVQISPEEMEEFDVAVAEALPGKLYITLGLPGEVAYDPDRFVHIVPRVPGIVRGVLKKSGDTVLKGDVMAVIDSREFASAKSSYLAGIETVSLAEATYDREKSMG